LRDGQRLLDDGNFDEGRGFGIAAVLIDPSHDDRLHHIVQRRYRDRLPGEVLGRF
jgi:hypothetical protein